MHLNSGVGGRCWGAVVDSQTLEATEILNRNDLSKPAEQHFDFFLEKQSHHHVTSRDDDGTGKTIPLGRRFWKSPDRCWWRSTTWANPRRSGRPTTTVRRSRLCKNRFCRRADSAVRPPRWRWSPGPQVLSVRQPFRLDSLPLQVPTTTTTTTTTVAELRKQLQRWSDDVAKRNAGTARQLKQ